MNPNPKAANDNGDAPLTIEQMRFDLAVAGYADMIADLVRDYPGMSEAEAIADSIRSTDPLKSPASTTEKPLERNRAIAARAFVLPFRRDERTAARTSGRRELLSPRCGAFRR